MTDLYGAIDLGGTKVRALVATLDGAERGYDIRLSETELGLEAVLDRMCASLEAAAAQAGVAVDGLRGLGIASPGAIDAAAGVVTQAPQLPGWKDVPLAHILSERLGLPARLENDASAAALGEHRYGAGRGARHMVYLTVSTGIGGGIIIDGRLYRGASGAAGELGHVIIDVDSDAACKWCGRGCLEVLASGTAIARRGERLLREGAAPVLAALVGEGGSVGAEVMAEAARRGDGGCREAFAEAGRYLGVGLANYLNIFNPEAIVVGGGVSRSGDLLMAPARETMRRHAIREALEHARVETAALGEKSGLLGMIAVLAEAAAEG